jgi:hypothetical protein
MKQMKTVLILLVIAALFGCIASDASAYVAPTKAELAEMTAAGEREVAEAGWEVQLTGMRVEGGWAAGLYEARPKPSERERSAFVIFRRESGHWHVAGSPDNGCSPGAELPIPIAVQQGLELPTCGIGLASLGQQVMIRDSTGIYESRPHGLKIKGYTHTVWLTHISSWRLWNTNRSMSAEANGYAKSRNCTPDCENGKVESHRVEIRAHGYRRCPGVKGFVFRELEWWKPSDRAAFIRVSIPCRGVIG